LRGELRRFGDFGTHTTVTLTPPGPGVPGAPVETFVNEFWTSRQRAANRLHEISYRACFKAQLPRFFIERLTSVGDRVYDPFMGRGTSVLEAALIDRVPLGTDVNPLSRILVEPRLNPPTLDQIAGRLEQLSLQGSTATPDELDVFYHQDTLREICALREYFAERERTGTMDSVDGWIRMVAVNRLTGHSPGFFSVYTLPPNQAVSVSAQRKINERRGQTPPRRSVRELILRKSKSLLSDCGDRERAALARVRHDAKLLADDAEATPEIPTSSVQLIVTSPPFLDVVQYAADNWLRCWFCAIDPAEVPIAMHRDLPSWSAAMTRVFAELLRVLVPGGHVAFEVGEVRGGKVKLEESVIPCGIEAGLEPLLVLINQQQFTKTANCWGVDNNKKGTNSNRVVLFRKA
jgi:hypothetical protein